MAGSNYNNTDNKAINEKDAQSMENKTVNGVVLDDSGAGTNFLADDGVYKTPAGGGDVTGPASSVTDNFASFADTTGKTLKDAGVSASDFAQQNTDVDFLDVGLKSDTAFYARLSAATGMSVDYLLTLPQALGTSAYSYMGFDPSGDAEFFPAPDNRVFVNSESDLPAPSGGVITLSASTTYEICGIITTANTIELGAGSALVGRNRFADFINYTGTGDMFTYQGTGSFTCGELGLICANGRVFNMTGSVAGETGIFYDSYIVTCDKVGVWNDWDILVFRSFSVVAATAATGAGMSFTGACTSFNMDNSLWQGMTTGNTMIDLGSATFERIQIPTGCRFATVSGVTAISGLANSGNINSGGSGIITNNIFTGDGTYLNNIDKASTRWNIRNNPGVEDTIRDAKLFFTGNATATTISAVDTPVKVAGTWTTEFANQFTTDATGRATYDGETDENLPIIAKVIIEPVSGSNINISAYIAIDGVVETTTRATGKASSGDPVTLTFFDQHPFVDADNTYIELFVENNSNATNLLASESTYIIN